MTASPGHAPETLWEDGELVLSRGLWDGEASLLLAAMPSSAQPSPETLARLQHAYALREELDELERASTPDERFHELGDVLFAAVNVSRKLKVDPELALRSAADRFRGRVSQAADLAASERRSWNDLDPADQLAYYARARLSEGESQDP